ncbi:hypothetical protein [Clostridioides sp. ZZV15-6597]|uniref:hypothetical protein n=1 Tax=Clostridioides sp. ZZV15-6597 TaxID=2811500 RepID=UPI001D111360|nr:hypothetical protein [Clostridioides sp. ZZV15-6597]HBF1820583.1 hypothetical protein [Clostridioides difficile]
MYRFNLLKIILIFCIALSMVGCKNDISYDVAYNKVETYNKLVSSTLESYKKALTYAQSKKNIIEDIYKDTGIALNEKYKLKRMTSEEKKAFEIRNSIALDKYFTSLGMDGVKEIIILNGSDNYIMTIVLYFGINDLLAIERNIYINN